jgi:hypothetical protein
MTYLYPFPEGTRISQPFGTNPNNGVNPGGGHTGTDWAVPVGTPIRAAADGVIELSSWVSDNYLANAWWLTRYGGDMIVLNCGGSAPTFVYAHLSESTAEVGQRVKKGDIIALSGNSGTATTGPHCHMEALPPFWNFQNGTYGRVNPDTYLDEHWAGISLQGAVITPEEDTVTPEQVQEIKTWIQTCVNKAISDNWATEAVTQRLIQEVAAGLNKIQTGAVDVAAVAKAVNDDAAKRMEK